MRPSFKGCGAPETKLTERALDTLLASVGDCVGVVLMTLGPSEIRRNSLATVEPLIL